MTATQHQPLTSTRLFHDEVLATIVDRALAGRRVFVAASTIDAGRALMHELQAGLLAKAATELGYVAVTWSAMARYFWANGQERIDVQGAGTVVFNSINSTRIFAVTADVALVNYRASDDYLGRLLPALILDGTTEPELFEIDC